MSRPRYDGDGGVYCGICGPDLTPSSPSEVDCPLHCEECHRPLDYSLTPDGVEYVVGRLREAIVRGLDDSPSELPYYKGEPHWSICEDWAQKVKGYGGLEPAEKEIIDLYLEICDHKRKAVPNG